MTADRIGAYLSNVFPEPSDSDAQSARERVLQNRELCRKLFESGHGNHLPKVRATLWAAYNGVTEAVDYHFRNRSPENRLESVWFGSGYLTKARAFRVAVNMANAWKN